MRTIHSPALTASVSACSRPGLPAEQLPQVSLVVADRASRRWGRSRRVVIAASVVVRADPRDDLILAWVQVLLGGGQVRVPEDRLDVDQAHARVGGHADRT